MLYTITKKMTKKAIKIFENIIGKKIKEYLFEECQNN